MNNKAITALAFAAGAAVGSAVTWHLLKTKYEQIVSDMREYYRAKEEKEQKEQKETLLKSVREKPNLSSYKNLIDSLEYTTPEGEDIESEEEEPVTDEPYVITPDEFAEADGYDAMSTSYYADGVLADNWDERIDLADIGGEQMLTHFGEYEPDALYVRNPRLKMDYEILKDLRKYSEVVAPAAPEVGDA